MLGRATGKLGFIRHHGPNLGEATTFPLMVFSVPLHMDHIQMAFCLGTPTTRTLATLGAHTFACRPLIAMRFEAKLYPSSRAFQRYVTRHLHVRKSGRFLTFSGQESNCWFAPDLSFDHNLCFRCPNGSYEPILNI